MDPIIKYHILNGTFFTMASTSVIEYTFILEHPENKKEVVIITP